MLTKQTVFDKIDFNGGNLSSDGGSILLLQFLKKLKLENELNSIHFNDFRHLPVYSNSGILYQLITRSLLGYFNQSDQSVLIHDPLLSKYVNACSQPTVSRFFDRAVQKTNYMLKDKMMKTACEYVNQHIDSPIIDADSTLITTSGTQQAASYIHHYAEVGYHPLVINEFQSKLLLSAQLRTGSSYSSNGIINELQTIFSYLHTDNVRFRGDSAFYDTSLFQYLESNKVTYYIRTKNYTSIKRETAFDLFVNEDVELYAYTQSHPYYADIEYEVAGDIARRVVYKAYWTDNKAGNLSLLPTIYCVVTNDREKTAEEIMDFYEQRGASENFTKELKNDFDGGRVSHKDFVKNEMEFLISSISYNIFHVFQNEILENEDKKITMNTFRMYYQKIAVKVIKHAREYTLSFSSSYNRQNTFIKYWNAVLQI